MPRYFFHVRNEGLSSQDDEGGDFDDFASAEYEAEMKKILTDDQFTKWKQLQTDRAKDRKGSRGANGGRRFRR